MNTKRIGNFITNEINIPCPDPAITAEECKVLTQMNKTASDYEIQLQHIQGKDYIYLFSTNGAEGDAVQLNADGIKETIKALQEMLELLETEQHIKEVIKAL